MLGALALPICSRLLQKSLFSLFQRMTVTSLTKVSLSPQSGALGAGALPACPGVTTASSILRPFLARDVGAGGTSSRRESLDNARPGDS